MKTVFTAMLVAALLIVVGGEKRANSSEVHAPPSVQPGISLQMAAFQGNIDAVRQHIAAGSDLNEKDAYGSTPLIIATTFGQNEAAETLIAAGADLNLKNKDGSTALHIAAFLCRTEIVEALLDKGADKYLRNDAGHTAFESVEAPFDDVKNIYDNLAKALGPLGLKLDYGHIRTTRPRIAKMLRPRTGELNAVVYTPLIRDDWAVSTPSAQGMDPKLVAELYLEATGLPTLYGLLVIKNGSLIAEAYFNEGSVEQASNRQSVTKSVYLSLGRNCVGSRLSVQCGSKNDGFFSGVRRSGRGPEKKADHDSEPVANALRISLGTAHTTLYGGSLS